MVFSKKEKFPFDEAFWVRFGVIAVIVGFLVMLLVEIYHGVGYPSP